MHKVKRHNRMNAMTIVKRRYQAGILNLPNDSMFKTIAVALLLCLVCSVIVSTAATLLKPAQVANKLLDKKRNIVAVAGLTEEGKSVEELFQRIDTRVVELETGNYTDKVDPLLYDQRKASKDPAMSNKLPRKEDIAGIGRQAKLANVYLLSEGEDVKKIILPIKGYGLWSTMYGFVALESDARTVAAVTFYEHGETPGLGGEIENPSWRKIWEGKKITDENGEPQLRIVKGEVNENTPDAQYKIDGLAGATLTSDGVTNLIHFWVGKNGFGPYLEKFRTSNAGQASIKNSATNTYTNVLTTVTAKQG